MHPFHYTLNPNTIIRYQQQIDPNNKNKMEKHRVQLLNSQIRPQQLFASKLMTVSSEMKQQKIIQNNIHVKFVQVPSQGKRERRHNIFEQVGSLIRKTPDAIKNKQMRAKFREQQEQIIKIQPFAANKIKKQSSNDEKQKQIMQQQQIIKSKNLQIHLLKLEIERFKRLQKLTIQNEQIKKRLINKLNELQCQNTILRQKMIVDNKQRQRRHHHHQSLNRHCHHQLQGHQRSQTHSKQLKNVQNVPPNQNKQRQKYTNQKNNNLQSTRYWNPESDRKSYTNQNRISSDQMKDQQQNNKHNLQMPKQQLIYNAFTFNKNDHQINNLFPKQYQKNGGNMINEMKQKNIEKINKQLLKKQFQNGGNQIINKKLQINEKNLKNRNQIETKIQISMKNELSKLPINLRLNHLNKQLQIKCKDLANSRRTYQLQRNHSMSILKRNNSNSFRTGQKYCIY